MLDGFVFELGDDYFAVIGEFFPVVAIFIPNFLVEAACVPESDNPAHFEFGVETSEIPDFHFYGRWASSNEFCGFDDFGIGVRRSVERNFAVNVQRNDSLFASPIICHSRESLNSMEIKTCSLGNEEFASGELTREREVGEFAQNVT